MPYFAALTGLFVALLVWAERREARKAVALFKTMASTSFVGCAVAANAWGTSYGRWILAALVFCWFGDAFLLSKRTALFTAGLFSFLIAHLLFSVAFLLEGVAWAWAGAAAVALIALGLAVGRWLMPTVEPALKRPVAAYIVAISSMVALGAGLSARAGQPVFLTAATAFFLSDLAVARDRFVKPGFPNRLWGLPLYYAAQVLFAVSVSPT